MVVGAVSEATRTAGFHCASCGSADVKLKHVTRGFGQGDALLIIEAIPRWSCRSCGEPYFSAPTMHEIERIKTPRCSVAVKRSVPVATFEAGEV